MASPSGLHVIIHPDSNAVAISCSAPQAAARDMAVARPATAAIISLINALTERGRLCLVGRFTTFIKFSRVLASFAELSLQLQR
jgi:hypothetical protein